MSAILKSPVMEGADIVGEAPSARDCISTCCPKTNPKNDSPLAGALVNVIVLAAML